MLIIVSLARVRLSFDRDLRSNVKTATEGDGTRTMKCSYVCQLLLSNWFPVNKPWKPAVDVFPTVFICTTCFAAVHTLSSRFVVLLHKGLFGQTRWEKWERSWAILAISQFTRKPVVTSSVVTQSWQHFGIEQPVTNLPPEIMSQRLSQNIGHVFVHTPRSQTQIPDV